MERRFLLFLAVSFLIVSVWARVFGPPATEPAEAGPGKAPAATERDVVPAEKGRRAELPARVETEARPADVEPPEKEEGPAEARAADRETRVVVDTGLVRLELSNAGARIVSATLDQHEDAEGRPYEMIAKRAAERLNLFPLDVRTADAGVTDKLRSALYEMEAPASLVLDEGESAEVGFVWTDGRGLEAEKRIVLRGGDYTVSVDVSVRQNGEELTKEILVGPGLGMEVSESRYVGREKGVLIPLGGEVRLLDAGEIAEGEGRAAGVSAAGIASHYFAALMLPVGDEVYGGRLETATVPFGTEEPAEREVATAALESTRGEAAFELYLGPKKLERLEGLRPGLSEIIELGWMRVPALLLRTGLMAIYEWVRNWGWAIVLLTFLINVLLVPLKHYSFVSMRRMQKLAPQIQHIRDKYKKVKPTDPRYQHMNQEIMTLYKEHNVNPISGCLPMLLMIPFFFAFYRLLMASIELRHASFLWVQDLSVYDPWFVLPILMGVTQVAIQKMTPQTTADPMQAKIMSFMPILFTFILAWAPAGLVLYWFSNNIVSMGQQMVTNRYLASQDDKRPEPEKGSGKGKKKGRKTTERRSS